MTNKWIEFVNSPLVLSVRIGKLVIAWVKMTDHVHVPNPLSDFEKAILAEASARSKLPYLRNSSNYRGDVTL